MGSIAQKGDALRAYLSAAEVSRLAAAGCAPAGAVGLAISRVLRRVVDLLHASLRTSTDRTVGKAMDGVVKVVRSCAARRTWRTTSVVSRERCGRRIGWRPPLSGSSKTTATSRGAAGPLARGGGTAKWWRRR